MSQKIETTMAGSAGTELRPQPASVPAPLRLWLVDDNDRLRQTVAELLTREQGIACDRSFSSATAALSALASKTGPDVILLDIQMGEENGLDAVRPIKSLARNTRVFMFTTVSDEHARVRAREDGASGFLLKCYPIQKIVATIRSTGEFSGVPAPRRRRSDTGKSGSSRLPGEKCAAGRTNSRVPETDMLGRCLSAWRSFWN
jgi:DNA-binding NtrC family response regulator